MKNIDESNKQQISNFHPTDKELADFIDDKLSIEKRGIVLWHLIVCDECSDIVFFVIKDIKKKY
jgi:hypothetical protein